MAHASRPTGLVNNTPNENAPGRNSNCNSCNLFRGTPFGNEQRICASASCEVSCNACSPMR
eukprot:9464323-Lingulodinium_polyedra.AAC.1